MSRFIYLGISLFLFLQNPDAQAQEMYDLPEVTPPSPVAHELGKYGEVPIGLYTGTLQQNISLLQYKNGDINVPVSLSYGSNGVKVDEIGSQVGINWSLNSGGVITRTVYGKPDELRNYTFPYSIIDNYLSDEAIEFYYDAGNNSDLDTQTDVFSFNFMGYSGRFALDNNGTIIQLEAAPLKIEKLNTYLTSGFKITDEKGFVYYFQDIEESFSRTSGSGGPSQPEDLKITGWYLSSIISPKGNQVDFIYDSSNYNYALGNSQSLTVASPVGQSPCSPHSPPASFTINPIQTSWLYIAGKKLIRIEGSELGSLNFNYDYTHPEVSGYKLLSKIELKTIAGVVKDDVAFSYDYSLDNRVFLQNVTYKDPDQKYTFEYYDVDGLPARLSKSQDHWGFYNGKDNSYYFPNPSNLEHVSSALSQHNLGANKNPDPVYGVKGLLKKITYPTKGTSEFTYVANSYAVEELVNPSSSAINLTADTGYGTMGNSESAILQNIQIDQQVSINYNVDLNDYDSNCVGSYFPQHHITASISIQNLTNSQSNIILKQTSTGKLGIGNSYGFKGSDTAELYFDLKAGNDYQVTISTSKECLFAGLNFNYFPGSQTITEVNKVSGGLGLEQVKNLSAISASPEYKRYYYSKHDNTSVSSGIKGATPWYVAKNTTRLECSDSGSDGFGGGHSDVYYETLHSNSLRQLYSTASNMNTSYEYVTISHGGNNFETGAEEFKYNYAQDSQSFLIYGNYQDNVLQMNTGWDNGKLAHHKTYKKSGSSLIMLNSITNEYTKDPAIQDTVFGFTIIKKFELVGTIPPPLPDIGNIENLDIARHALITNWSYLSKSTEVTYEQNGSNPQTKVKEYFYENPLHQQLTKSQITDSKGNTTTKYNDYPDDVTSTSALGYDALTSTEYNAINSLKSIIEHRINKPVQTIQKVTSATGSLLSQAATRTLYKDDGNLVLPSIIQSVKNGFSLEDRLEYHRYDASGNPVDVSKTEGSHVIYLWGYNDQFPIAKIENATYSAVASALGKTVSTLDTTIDESDMAAINLLRSNANLPQSLITTYTYDPLIGITNMRDSRGSDTQYTYDNFGRLQSIKDDAGNLIKDFKYHYQQ